MRAAGLRRFAAISSRAARGKWFFAAHAVGPISSQQAGQAGPGDFIMNCIELAERIQLLEPRASAKDVARVCLLLTNNNDNLEQLRDPSRLEGAWKETGLKLQAATDQHAAMTQELEELANSDPEKYSQEQVWVLIRAIKVQSQVLQLYVGQPVLDV
jgi:hypothetical protein